MMVFSLDGKEFQLQGETEQATKTATSIAEYFHELTRSEELQCALKFLKLSSALAVKRTQLKIGGDGKSAIQPFQNTMVAEMFVHLAASRGIPGTIAMQAGSDILGVPRMDPGTLEEWWKLFVKRRTIYIVIRRAGKTSTLQLMTAALLLTQPLGYNIGYYCSDDKLGIEFGGLTMSFLESVMQDVELQTRLSMESHCHIDFNNQISARDQNKRISISPKGSGKTTITSSSLLSKSVTQANHLRGLTHDLLFLDEFCVYKENSLISLLPHATLDVVKMFCVCSPIPGPAVQKISYIRSLLLNNPDKSFNFFMLSLNCSDSKHGRFLASGTPCPCGKYVEPDHVKQGNTDKELTEIMTGNTSKFYEERGMLDQERMAIRELMADEQDFRGQKNELEDAGSAFRWIKEFESSPAGCLVPMIQCVFSSRFINTIYFSELTPNRVPETQVDQIFMYVDPAYGGSAAERSSGIGIVSLGFTRSRGRYSSKKQLVVLGVEHVPVMAEWLGHVPKKIAQLICWHISAMEQNKRALVAVNGDPLLSNTYHIIIEKNSNVDSVVTTLTNLFDQLAKNDLKSVENRIMVYSNNNCNSSGEGPTPGKRSRMSNLGCSIPGFTMGQNKKQIIINLSAQLNSRDTVLSLGLMTFSVSLGRFRQSENMMRMLAQYFSRFVYNPHTGKCSGKQPSETNNTGGPMYAFDDLTIAFFFAFSEALNMKRENYLSLQDRSLTVFKR